MESGDDAVDFDLKLEEWLRSSIRVKLGGKKIFITDSRDNFFWYPGEKLKARKDEG